MNKLSISVKYSLLIFLLFTSLGLLASHINAVNMRKNADERMKEEYLNFKNRHLYMLARDLWMTDYENLQKQLDVAVSFEYIDYIKIIDEDGAEYDSGVFYDELALNFSAELEYIYKDQNIKIGDIYLYHDSRSTDMAVRHGFFFNFGLMFFSSILLSFLSIILFRSLVGRHIKSMSDFLVSDQQFVLEYNFSLNRSEKVKDELTVLSDSLNEMRNNAKNYLDTEKELVRKLEAEADFRDRIFSIISHDLRGPISSYKVLTQTIVDNFDSTPPERIKLIFEEINKSSQSLSSMMENLLDWAKSTSEQIIFNPQAVDAEQLLDTVTEIIRPTAVGKNQKITAKVDERLEFFADKQMIESVLRNLISNAVKFTPPSGKIEIRTGRMSGSSGFIEVIDNGLGIPKQKLDAFQENGRIESTRGTENEKGTGLGLGICSQFLKINRGELKLSSEPGKGTRAMIILPLKSSQNG